MAIDDLDAFREALPKVFEDKPLPADWDEKWHVVPVDSPGDEAPAAIEAEDPESGATSLLDSDADFWETWARDWEPVDWPEEFPGSPRTRSASPPGPDQPRCPVVELFAFYLPYHFYHPAWWGVYLIAEGVRDLASYIRWASGRKLSRAEGTTAARLFLYRHEAFHHGAECFATRLEATHRMPLYRLGFRDLYRSTFGTDACQEEALANAYGVRKTLAAQPDQSRDLVAKALRRFVDDSPSGYRVATSLLEDAPFFDGRLNFAESCQNAALPHLVKMPSAVWGASPHAFGGISQVDSRVNYLVRRNSPLATRLKIDARYIKYRELARRLQRQFQCYCERQGNGSHELWRSKEGRTTILARHPGDLKKGTVLGILRDLGISMSWESFLAS